jgi:hypothetical protein
MKRLAVALTIVVLGGGLWGLDHVRAAANPPAARNSDPPAFGMVRIFSDQGIRVNVFCPAHGVNGFPPDPCRGILMLHTASGDVLDSSPYDLQPGQGSFLEFSFPADAEANAHLIIIPCILPDPTGGRGISSAEVFDRRSGRTTLVLNPAALRLSDIQGDQGSPQSATEIR